MKHETTTHQPNLTDVVWVELVSTHDGLGWKFLNLTNSGRLKKSLQPNPCTPLLPYYLGCSPFIFLKELFTYIFKLLYTNLNGFYAIVIHDNVRHESTLEWGVTGSLISISCCHNQGNCLNLSLKLLRHL